ncbi:unnamed protein product, partial [Brassica rapa subsp. trilocularis]
LSPLYPSQTNDLHFSIATGLHQSFLWLRPRRHSSPSFGSRQACSHSNPSQKIKVGGCAPVRDPANKLPCALWVYSPVDSHTCQTPWSIGLLHSASDWDESPALIRFPPENFKHSLTLFSKSFHLYLAVLVRYRSLAHIYPWTEFTARLGLHSQTTRLVVRQGPGTTGLSPSLAPLSRELGPGPSLRTLLQTTIQTSKTSDFQVGLFP